MRPSRPSSTSPPSSASEPAATGPGRSGGASETRRSSRAPQPLWRRRRRSRRWPAPAGTGPAHARRRRSGSCGSRRGKARVGVDAGQSGADEPAQGRNGGGFYNLPMSVIALGLNHSTAPLDLRGRFAFAPEQLATALLGFRERIRPHARPEAALLSTCNRTELYFAAEQRPRPANWCARPSTGWRRRAASAANACSTTPTCWKTAPRRAMPSAWPRGWIRWCWASRRSWAR